MYSVITVNTTREGADFVASALFDIGSQGAQIIDTADILEVMKSGTYWDYVDEKLLVQSDIVKVSGFVSSAEASAKVAELLDILNGYTGINFGSLEVTVAPAPEINWYEHWKEYYRPITAGRYLIVPKWLKPEENTTKTVILIDPGMAFGSGEHESTRLCLSLMSMHDYKDKVVIDVGTGSGILGIASLLSGAKTAHMCDIDSCAVQSATENAVLNGVEKRAQITAGDLLSACGFITADYVFANLTADILLRLAKDIAPYLATDGFLTVSGIILPKKQQVIDAFTAVGLTLTMSQDQGDWSALEFTKKPQRQTLNVPVRNYENLPFQPRV